MEGGCVTDCTSHEGALFCDGQFVDHDNNLEKCIDALKNLDASIEWEASGNVSVGCSAGNSGLSTLGPVVFLLLPALVVLWSRRRE
jgi:hypothetical protein